jgi:hypothetical protein
MCESKQSQKVMSDIDQKLESVTSPNFFWVTAGRFLCCGRLMHITGVVQWYHNSHVCFVFSIGYLRRFPSACAGDLHTPWNQSRFPLTGGTICSPQSFLGAIQFRTSAINNWNPSQIYENAKWRLAGRAGFEDRPYTYNPSIFHWDPRDLLISALSRDIAPESLEFNDPYLVISPRCLGSHPCSCALNKWPGGNSIHILIWDTNSSLMSTYINQIWRYSRVSDDSYSIVYLRQSYPVTFLVRKILLGVSHRQTQTNQAFGWATLYIRFEKIVLKRANVYLILNCFSKTGSLAPHLHLPSSSENDRSAIEPFNLRIQKRRTPRGSIHSQIQKLRASFSLFSPLPFQIDDANSAILDPHNSE